MVERPSPSIVNERRADSSAMIEGRFGLRIGQHEVHVDASVDPKLHRVDLQFTPNALALAEAQPLLEKIKEISYDTFGEVLREAYED